MIRPAMALGVLGAVAAVASGQAIFHSSPDWISADKQVSTGAALADLDRDGWPDLVVANGNDIYQQRLVVYYNNGDGTFPSTPNWQSTDIAYNGHLDVADVNGDGWPDVAVSHLGEFSTVAPIARLYLNNLGTLSSSPDWVSDIDGNAFGVDFGDVNNDGRPDLAVATGWAYSPQHFYPTYVYLNVGGALEATASWESDDTYHYQGALWVDGDNDGWLDLVGVASHDDSRIYRNLGGVLETTASWQTTDASDQDAIMAACGDVNGDGHRDLFLTDNVQIAGGSGRFRQYDGVSGGLFSTTYGWSYYEGYGSAIALVDANADGLLDLATGAWWDYSRIFLNQGTGFGSSPDWSSSVTSVIEKIVFADFDRSALRRDVDTFAPLPGQHLFYLDRQQIESVLSVRADGEELDPDEYTFSREDGWLTVGETPAAMLEVDYLFSLSPDMAITNWDSSKGNYAYYNQRVANGNCDGDGDVDLDDYDCFFDCLTGPGVVVDDGCLVFDTDLDRDVDLADMAAFAAWFTGS